MHKKIEVVVMTKDDEYDCPFQPLKLRFIQRFSLNKMFFVGGGHNNDFIEAFV